MKQVERYRVFELVLPGMRAEGSFQIGDRSFAVKGFLSGDNQVTVRFMPDAVGMWTYQISSDLEAVSGSFECSAAKEGNHGPVRVNGKKFAYADGSRYLPFGTTCYGWVHQENNLRLQTLETLKASPFNKIRMLLFPKSMVYNTGEPQMFPFLKDQNGNWDVQQPNFLFWEDLEQQILELDKLGIQADLILFHPYDRWGFATLSREDCLAYTEYCVNRFGAYKNIWWSLANEYDMVPGKTEEDWDAIAERICQLDAAKHLLSIHNCCQVFPNRDWMTHCSIQTNLCRQTLTWGWEYQKPVLIDECGYEGDIEFTWGNLSAFEMANRFWTVMACGGYCTHGETFFREDEILWWGKGGVLRGESVERIAFLRNLLEALPGVPETIFGDLKFDLNGSASDHAMAIFGAAVMRLPQAAQTAFIAELIPMVLGNCHYRIYYLGRTCPGWLDVDCPDEGTFQAEVIDVWNMTRTPAGEITGGGRIKLPAKEGQAILLTKIQEA